MILVPLLFVRFFSCFAPAVPVARFTLPYVNLDVATGREGGNAASTGQRPRERDSSLNQRDNPTQAAGLAPVITSSLPNAPAPLDVRKPWFDLKWPDRNVLASGPDR